MITVVAVALGAALGAPLRFAIERRFAATQFPSGLLVVNVAGSLIAGVVMAATSGVLQQFLLVGFCGALTTYSGFAWQASNVWRERRQIFWAAVSVMTIGCAVAFLVSYQVTALLVG